MTESIRRSKRIASIKDELSVSSNEPLPIKKATNKKTDTKAKVSKPVKKTAVSKQSKSRSAKKEDAVVLDDDEEEEKKEVKDKGELEEGESLPPNLVMETQDSKEINLLDYAKKSHILVIFAYPRASTPGCTRQAQGFRDEYEELNGEYKANVLGLSADSAKAQTTFKTKQNLPYDLLCDTKKELITLLGCKKQPSGIIRSHFIFVDGILKVKKVKISPEDSFKSALKQVIELSN